MKYSRELSGYPELAFWLALLNIPSIGPVTFIEILKQFPKISELFTLPIPDLKNIGFNEMQIQYLLNPDWKSIQNAIYWQENKDNHIIKYNDGAYPKALLEVPGAPPIIYVKGNLASLNTLQLAMVGTRHPTANGAEIAYQFAEKLAEKGFTITSGLAMGIDGVAHQGALSGKGLTIAVLGSGLNHIYPIRHKKLAEQIIDSGGALLSEFSLEVRPYAENFPRRNRIISGLSLGVLVVEAAIQSGSLITAKYAIEQGREVFAVPGSIYNPLAKGCHVLLKQGAKLVETINDILEELAGYIPNFETNVIVNNKNPLDFTALDTHYRKLVECIDFETTPMDMIIHRSGLAAEAVSSMVLMLELQGYIQAVNGGYSRKG